MSSLRPSFAAELRRDLATRNLQYAQKHGLPAILSCGEPPVVCFKPNGEVHGNFLYASYRAILANPEWRRRIAKPHTQARSAFASCDGSGLKELDSSNSSDALLMNVFCYPRVFTDGRMYALLGVAPGSHPQFGWKARVSMRSRLDATEVDMRLDDLLVEAKFTEADFQTAPATLVESYRDFADIFDTERLPRVSIPRRTVSHADDFSASLSFAAERSAVEQSAVQSSIVNPQSSIPHYQLIRNVLAAHAHGCSFCVIHDARRPDLREAWYAVMACVRNADLRTRCKVLTWQEVAGAAPRKLQAFLDEKYGICSDNTV